MHVFRGHHTSLAAIATVLLGSTSAGAADGRIPIYQAATINQPGDYVVTRDIQGSGTLLSITASNVRIDLAGHRLSNAGSGATISVGDGTADVAIGNGIVTGGTRGIYGNAPAGMRVHVEGISISGTSSSAIELTGLLEVTVARCRIRGAAGRGIELSGTSYAGRIVDNDVRGVGTFGITATGLTGGLVQGNVVQDFGTAGSSYAGILVMGSSGGNRIAENQVGGGSGDYGIRDASPGDHIEGNVVRSCGTGILADSTHIRVTGNTVSANENTGILVGNPNTHALVEGNHATANGGYGLDAGTSTTNRYRNNFLLGNGVGAVTGGQNSGGNITA